MGVAGSATLKTDDLPWDYMVDIKGKHVHTYKCNRIYVQAGNDEDIPKENAVGKVLRLLVEGDGGNVKGLKQRIDARYVRYVWGAVGKCANGLWAKVAHRSAEDAVMKLLGVLQASHPAFDA